MEKPTPSVIEVRLETIAQLFNSLDPSPFRSRDLDAGTEEFIVDWARELPANSPVRITIQMPQYEARRADEIDLIKSVAHYFEARERKLDIDLKEHFVNGWRYPLIGVPLLAVCLIASQIVGTSFGHGPVVRVIEESLIIVGWVANWKPIETFLYGWWPIVRQRSLYRWLAHSSMEVVAE